MNYQYIYDRLIERARNRTLTGTYVERHHVVPRCMGGSDDKSNIVELLAEEHYLCHLLLARIHPTNNKLVFAAGMMTLNSPMHSEGRRGNKRYSWLRKAHAKAVSESMAGVPKSPEHNAKVSAALMGKPGTRRGAVLTDDTKDKMSVAALARTDKEENDQKMRDGRANMTSEESSAVAYKAWETKRANGTDKASPETKAKMSASQLAREETPEQAKARGIKAAETRRANGTDKYSDESREKMRQSQLGKKQSPETVAKRQATIARNKALKASQSF